MWEAVDILCKMWLVEVKERQGYCISMHIYFYFLEESAYHTFSCEFMTFPTLRNCVGGNSSNSRRQVGLSEIKMNHTTHKALFFSVWKVVQSSVLCRQLLHVAALCWLACECGAVVACSSRQIFICSTSWASSLQDTHIIKTGGCERLTLFQYILALSNSGPSFFPSCHLQA